MRRTLGTDIFATENGLTIGVLLTIIMVSMVKKRSFELIYAPVIKEHLNAIDKKYYSLIRHKLEEQLSVEPDRETRNKKPLKRPVTFKADWEIRFGPNNRFRVFYQINRPERQVFILALGEKKGNRLFIGGKEVPI